MIDIIAPTADITAAGSFRLGDRAVNRLGYGAMQLAGPGVFGPPKDRDAALAVLREAVASGVNHIDTSDYQHPPDSGHHLAQPPAREPRGRPACAAGDCARRSRHDRRDAR